MRSFFKQKEETKTVSIDFSPVLSTGETISLSNVTVTASQIDTGTDATSTIVASGTIGVSDNIISFRIRQGESDKTYKVTVSTGATSASNVHEEDIVVIVSDDINLLYSVDELKSGLGITDTSKDALIFGLVRGATDWVSNACARNFSFKSYTETFYLDEKADTIIVSHFPVASVSSVTIDGTAKPEETAGVKNWVVDESGQVSLVDGSNFVKKPYANVITYKAGFQVVPEDIRMAVKKIATHEYLRRVREGILAETIGDYKLVYNRESLLDDAIVRQVIERYKKRLF